MCVPGCHEAVVGALSRRGFFKGAAAAGFAATAIPAPVQAQAAPRAFQSVLDLTHVMGPDFPTFFGVPGVELQKQLDLKTDGFNLNWWRIVEHAGTHIDAPIHFIEGGVTVESIPAETLVVPLAVVDVAVAAAQNADYQLSREDLAGWERAHGRLPAGCCVAMHSGWARHVRDAAKFTGKDASGTFHFPGIAPEAAEWLLKERQAAGLASDTMSLDHGSSKDFRTHKLWLGAGRWGLENVANLDRAPPSGATLVVGAPKVQNATGGLTRVLALV